MTLFSSLDSYSIDSHITCNLWSGHDLHVLLVNPPAGLCFTYVTVFIFLNVAPLIQHG